MGTATDRSGLCLYAAFLRLRKCMSRSKRNIFGNILPFFKFQREYALNFSTWRVTEGHREREGRGVKFLESEAEGYEDFLVEKA